MQSKLFWFDTETTGLDPKKNAMIQLAGMVEVDHEVVEEFNIMARPHKGAEITAKALEVNGRTLAEIQSFPTLFEAISLLRRTLAQYVDKFDPKDKLIMAGFRTDFDGEFLRECFRRVQDRYFGSWFFNCSADISTLLAIVIAETGLRLENWRLSTACEHFGIHINAHDALSDIKATRELYHVLMDIMGDINGWGKGP